MKRSTHVGECQICGSKQMLPAGTLSNHGYTVECGFFSGICAGAGKLPFEQSKDNIAPVVAAVERTIADVALDIAAYKDVANEVNGTSKAWVKDYSGRFGYFWAQVELVVKQNQNPGSDYVWQSCMYQTEEDGKQRTHRVEAYSHKLTTLREWVHYCNCKYAEDLEQVNSQRRQWVKWQQERLANWAVKPLTLRGDK